MKSDTKTIMQVLIKPFKNINDILSSEAVLKVYLEVGLQACLLTSGLDD